MAIVRNDCSQDYKYRSGRIAQVHVTEHVTPRQVES